MIWFCDTSVVLKRYVRERGSQWFRRHVSNHRVVLAKITPLEVKSGLALRVRTGSLSQFDFFKARNTLTRHLLAQHYDVWPLTDQILDLAGQLVYRHPLRAYDAVQLATAWDYVKTAGVDRKHFCFLTADNQLERAAKAEGLNTENPNRHP